MTETKKVLVVGATGALGGLIARAVKDRGADLRLLVRSASRGKLGDLAEGAEIVEGDLDAPDALARATEGVATVISSLQGMGDVLVDGQMRLFRAAVRAGARRFIPSSFSFDLFNLAEGESGNSDIRRAFARAAAAERGSTEIVHVLNGCFLDARVLGFLGLFDAGAWTVQVWGDGSSLVDFTTYEDTARFTAEAALDPEPLPERFNVAGDTLSVDAFARTLGEVTGRAPRIEQRGSLADLNAEIERRRTAEPHNPYAIMPLTYYRGFVDGKGKLGPLANGRYPHVRPTTVRDFAAKLAR